jgi:hypothetical protein
MEIIIGQRQDIRRGIAKTVRVEKYFPKTIDVTVVGEVKISWSVFVWRSSAMVRIVITGVTKMKIEAAEPRVAENVG